MRNIYHKGVYDKARQTSNLACECERHGAEISQSELNG